MLEKIKDRLKRRLKIYLVILLVPSFLMVLFAGISIYFKTKSIQTYVCNNQEYIFLENYNLLYLKNIPYPCNYDSRNDVTVCKVKEVDKAEGYLVFDFKELKLYVATSLKDRQNLSDVCYALSLGYIPSYNLCVYKDLTTSCAKKP